MKFPEWVSTTFHWRKQLILTLENLHQQVENTGEMDQEYGENNAADNVGGQIAEDYETKPEVQQLYDTIQKRTLSILLRNVGISRKSDLQRSHIPELIKEGIVICIGVMKNKSRDNCGTYDIFKRLIINAEIVLREIHYQNKKLGDQKFTVYQIFGHFLADLRNELVKIFLDTDIARSYNRQVTIMESTEPTFATGIEQVIVFVFICYCIKRAEYLQL